MYHLHPHILNCKREYRNLVVNINPVSFFTKVGLLLTCLDCSILVFILPSSGIFQLYSPDSEKVPPRFLILVAIWMHVSCSDPCVDLCLPPDPRSTWVRSTSISNLRSMLSSLGLWYPWISKIIKEASLTR